MMMPEIPTVQSLEAVDLHLRLILQKIDEIQSRQAEMVTKAELAAEIARLNSKIDTNSVRSFWRRLTEIAVGIVALSTAIGFAIAVVEFIQKARV
jgi:hypothetical protein